MSIAYFCDHCGLRIEDWINKLVRIDVTGSGEENYKHLCCDCLVEWNELGNSIKKQKRDFFVLVND